jgi:hypothetical protein
MTETASIQEVADELINVTPQPMAVGIEVKTEILSSTSIEGGSLPTLLITHSWTVHLTFTYFKPTDLTDC